MLVSLGALLTPLRGGAQPVRDSSAFSDIRPDGNGVPELRARIRDGFSGPASRALSSIAVIARLNITYDPRLPELANGISIEPHERSVAAALLEIARAAKLQMLVSVRGQIIVEAARPPVSRVARDPRDSASIGVASLAGVRVEAGRVELESFRRTAAVNVYSASREALHAVPGFVEADVLRSIQALPGIQARSDWSAGFNVRGGESDQTLVLLDGHPIYSPFHLGGIFSTFIDAVVGRVEMHAGGMPARFGGRLSGVLDVQSAEPTDTSLTGTASVSLISTSASVARAFRNGRGGWSLGARRTYADAVVNLFERNLFPYHFEDVNAHLSRSMLNGIRLGLTGYVGRDVGNSDESDARAAFGNRMLGLSMSGPLAASPGAFAAIGYDSVSFEQRASFTRFSALLGRPFTGEFLFNGTQNDVTEWRASGAIAMYRARSTTSVGYELTSQNLLYSGIAAYEVEGERVFPFDSLSRRSRAASLYASHVWRPTQALLLDLGARAEAVEGSTDAGVSPRVALKYFVSPSFAISAGGARYTQWVHALGREEEPIQPLQFWALSDSTRPVSTVKEATTGFEGWLTPSRMLRVGGFLKRYENLLVANQASDPERVDDSYLTASGTTYGVDVQLRQFEGRRFSGWLSYSYALSTRSGSLGERYTPLQDRRHNMNAVGSWRGARYTWGLRAGVGSGLPYTPVLGAYTRGRFDPATQRWVAEGILRRVNGPLNSRRLPMYKRLDATVTRSGRLWGAEFNPYLSIVNVLGASNPAAYFYSFSRISKRADFPSLPFVPTFGVNLVF